MLPAAILAVQALGSLPSLAAPASAHPLQEVVVTARKIAEDVQRVPMSIQMLGSAQLEAFDVTSVYELQFDVPGLVINSLGLFGANLSLRGVADTGGAGSSVATHVNGVYLGDARLPIARIFDLERIEVLKGPQGILYGRNASAGSLNIMTRPPGPNAGAAVEAAYGSFSMARAHGHVDLAPGKSAVRLAFVASDSDGYVRNSVDGRKFAESDYGGLRASARFDAERLRVDVMAQHVEDDGAMGELWTPNPEYLPDPYDIHLTNVTAEDPHLDLESSIVSVELDYDLGFGAMRAVSGFARSEMDNLDDCFGRPGLEGCIRGGSDSYDQWSQEVRLHFNEGGATSGLVGLYWFDAEADSTFDQRLGEVIFYDSNESWEESATAIFGQAKVDLGARFSLGGGLRLSREKQYFATEGSGSLDSPVPVSGRYRSSDQSWRIDGSYTAAADVQLYASVSTGFKSGGIVLRDGEQDQYAPEELISYEAGLKSQWLDRRLTFNASAFYYDYDNIQVRTTTATQVEVDDARARLYGIDAEGAWQVSERFAIIAGIVWMPERVLTDFADAELDAKLSGNTLPLAPRTSATAAIEYEQQLPGFGRLDARLEYDYRSDVYYTKENDLDYLQQGFGLVSATLKFENENGRWYLFATGRNLTDQDYFYQVYFQSSPGLPRNYEVGAGYRF